MYPVTGHHKVCAFSEIQEEECSCGLDSGSVVHAWRRLRLAPASSSRCTKFMETIARPTTGLTGAAGSGVSECIMIATQERADKRET